MLVPGEAGRLGGQRGEEAHRLQLGPGLAYQAQPPPVMDVEVVGHVEVPDHVQRIDYQRVQEREAVLRRRPGADPQDVGAEVFGLDEDQQFGLLPPRALIQILLHR